MESQNKGPVGELAGVLEGIIRAFEKVIVAYEKAIVAYQDMANMSRQREQIANQKLSKLEDDHGEDSTRES